MNGLTITISVPSLSILTPIGVNTYGLVIKLFDASNAPLVSAYVDDENAVTVTTTSTTFDVTIPLVDDTYSIPNVKFRAYANSSSSCCFADMVYTITNTGSETPPEETLLISGYFG